MKQSSMAVMAFFMIAFSMGMDLHHTNAIEGMSIQNEKAPSNPEPYEVKVVIQVISPSDSSYLTAPRK